MNQMRTVLPADVPKLFKKVDIDLINREYNRVLFWFADGKLKKYSGAEAEKKLRPVWDGLPKVDLQAELKAELAYPGHVKGRVCKILDIKDAGKFKPGDILVTRMTDPTYLPIMKQAKAIITDIGGITCHAAIMSRELKKTCLIGAKFATQVLNDGDRIEVDGAKGTIRKI